jgi:hypothetical protein
MTEDRKWTVRLGFDTPSALVLREYTVYAPTALIAAMRQMDVLLINDRLKVVEVHVEPAGGNG